MKKRSLWLCPLAIAAIVALDQWVKAYIVTHFAVGESKPFLPQLLRLHYVRNFGAAWSSFSGERWLLIGVTGVGMFALAWLLARIVRHPLGVWSLTAVIGGGVGTAIAYPQAKALHAAGLEVDMIAGFRSKEIVILEEEMKAVTDHLYLMTDDGSYGEKGLVTQKLEELIKAGNPYDLVIAIGPVIMMKFVARTTKEYGIRTIVSLNTLMVDGTGMCGACRVTVGGRTRFTCVEGPEFDGHEVDFDEAMRRQGMYKTIESRKARMAQERAEGHACRIGLDR